MGEGGGVKFVIADIGGEQQAGQDRRPHVSLIAHPLLPRIYCGSITFSIDHALAAQAHHHGGPLHPQLRRGPAEEDQDAGVESVGACVGWRGPAEDDQDAGVDSVGACVGWRGPAEDDPDAGVGGEGLRAELCGFVPGRSGHRCSALSFKVRGGGSKQGVGDVTQPVR